MEWCSVVACRLSRFNRKDRVEQISFTLIDLFLTGASVACIAEFFWLSCSLHISNISLLFFRVESSSCLVISSSLVKLANLSLAAAFPISILSSILRACEQTGHPSPYGSSNLAVAGLTRRISPREKSARTQEKNG